MPSFADFDHRRVNGAPHALFSICNNREAFSPLRKLRDPNQPHASATVRGLGGSPRLDRPVRWDRELCICASQGLGCRTCHSNQHMPASESSPATSTTADETARARLRSVVVHITPRCCSRTWLNVAHCASWIQRLLACGRGSQFFELGDGSHRAPHSGSDFLFDPWRVR